jgi:hypothetical protein
MASDLWWSGGLSARRAGSRRAESPPLHCAKKYATVTSTIAASATLPHTTCRFRRSSGASNVSALDVPMARSANDRSRADWKRSPRFFSRQRCTTRASSKGIIRWVTPKTSGVSVRIADSESMIVPRMNAGSPVIISYSTQPSEKMSVVGSVVSPRSCSGDM